MIGVIAAMGREIEGDREALLAGGEIAPVEGVGIFRRGEAGILPDGPRLGDIHGRVGAAQIRRDAGIAVEGLDAVEIGGAVMAFDRNGFRRLPRCGGAGRSGSYVGKSQLRKVRDLAHLIT